MEIGEKNGWNAGIKAEKIEIAKNMRREGMDSDLIIRLTGLSRDEIPD